MYCKLLYSTTTIYVHALRRLHTHPLDDDSPHARDSPHPRNTPRSLALPRPPTAPLLGLDRPSPFAPPALSPPCE
ncbi:uncharacterized protein SCHCODRAFT_02630294 [Schizophyllum commune H4-8]|uniref:uncharacterized protein n=1 Tax=Schizophyllum commune (strain H4-8 / FGSC 9210) TaxID=578458 RepID=UPI00215FE744|nr:uncharacterized protein SCHCODRAFT_02630294 [Schizophyllum commune H4-8]KAI5889868.1 hypothetical protein SCHCODRAFT_02630294 [Schizophyllum commune H4-8]